MRDSRGSSSALEAGIAGDAIAPRPTLPLAELGRSDPGPRNLGRTLPAVLRADILDARTAGALGFMPRLLIQATLPHRRPRHHELERVNGRVTLNMSAPRSTGLPYGSYPRLILAWLNTEALRTKSPELHLGPTPSSFMHKLNLTPVTGKRGTVQRLRDQLHRLFSTSIRCTNSNEDQGQVECVGYTIAHEHHLNGSPPGPSQGLWWKPTITLSDEFFREITTNAVPVDLRAVRTLKASPMALDTYAWLTYRMSYLGKPTLVPWENLRSQFGSAYSRLRDFKRYFLTSLVAVLSVYPKARVCQHTQGLLLQPSPSHVSPLSTGRRSTAAS